MEVAGLDLVVGGHWFNPGPTEVAGSQACCLRGGFLIPAPRKSAPKEVTGLGLLLQMSLAWACSRDHWPEPGLVEFTCLGLLPLSLTAHVGGAIYLN